MSEPLIALVSFGLGSALAAVLLWPRRGVLARYLGRRLLERVRIEDALKQLYNAEYAGRPAGLESLAGALELRRARVAHRLSGVESAGLVGWTVRGVELTESGRSYALEVLRSHRLWERYLADRTGLSPAEWHAEAERREHTMTPEEADLLSASLGHPRYDPHGDPIPGADGRMPPLVGESLTVLGAGDAAVVVHLEDEPAEVYAALVGAGLGPGTRLEVLGVAPGEVRIRATGREHRLESVVAASIEVVRLPGGGEGDAGVEALASLRQGEPAEVVRSAAACQGTHRRRLLDLGVVPGTVITARLRSASGDPVGYEIRGALIALRREQAERILVRRVAAGVKDGRAGAGDSGERYAEG
jgi:DtxR family Mn-dependent transcriptional regulator